MDTLTVGVLCAIQLFSKLHTVTISYSSCDTLNLATSIVTILIVIVMHHNCNMCMMAVFTLAIHVAT